jgi:hypothetical protein
MIKLYLEGRARRYPTAPRLIETFEGMQRHTLSIGTRPPVVFTTEPTRLKRQILSLLAMSRAYCGWAGMPPEIMISYRRI